MTFENLPYNDKNPVSRFRDSTVDSGESTDREWRGGGRSKVSGMTGGREVGVSGTSRSTNDCRPVVLSRRRVRQGTDFGRGKGWE